MSEGSDKGVTIEYPDESTVNIIEETNKQPQLFTLDRVFNPDTKQADIFNLASDSINDVIEGFNATIFAYGQTGSGKSFTMFGPSIEEEELCGIIPRACKYIFDYIHSDTTGIEFTIKCSFLEIYKEDVKDLLNPSSKKSLRIRESASKGVWVEGLYESCVTSVSEIMDLLKTGERFRTVTSTNMNAVSSRSHSLFILTLIQKFKDGSIKTGKLNLADLAGSEKVGKTGAKGNTLEEAKKINQSLSSLGNCINALTQENKAHVPYRDSKLTFILRESLGGNTKTTLIVACSPHPFNITETLSTLRFAQRAKTIKNTVTINAKRSVEELEGIIKGLLSELNDIKYYVKHLEKELSNYKGTEWNPEEEMKKVFENRNLNMPSLIPSKSESTDNDQITLVPTPIKPQEDNPVQIEMTKIENATQKDLNQIENQVRNDKLAEQLNEEIESLKDQLNSFKEEELKSKKQVSNFKDSFHQKDEELKKISHELQSLKQKHKTDTEKFEYDSKQLRYEIESSKFDLKMSLDKYNQLKEINSNQFLEIKNLEGQLEEIKKLKEEIDFKLREVNSQFLQAQEKESQTELKYQEVSNERSTYKKQSEQLNEEKRSLLENEKSLRSQLSKVQLQYEESKLEISSKVEEKEFVENNLNETINKLKQEINELNQSLSSNSGSNVSVEDQKKKDLLLESTTNENVENKKKILNLQSLFAQKDLECKSIISQFEEFTVQTQSYIKLMEKSESDNNNKLNEKEEKIVQLQNSLQESKSLVEQNKQKSFEVLREEINQWTNKLNKVEQDKKSIEEKLQETSNKLEEESNKAHILKEKQESSILRIQELEAKLEEAILNYDTTQVDLETALNLNIENAKKFERELQLTEEGFKIREERRKSNIVRSIVNDNTSSPSRWFKKKDPLPVANSLGKVDKSGYLTKQGDWVRSWRKKWMVLKDDKIYIFDSPQDEKPKAQIELSFESFVQRADEITNMENCFGIFKEGDKKVHYLKADSLDEVEEWMQEIGNNVRQLTKGISN